MAYIVITLIERIILYELRNMHEGNVYALL